MNMTSKVKADVQNISGELIVSDLDSATSLILAAKNLMKAVILTVKASYVASTKYPRQGTISSPIVVWKMKAPEKKPLVRPEKSEEVRAKVRKGSQKRCRIRFTPSRNSRVPQNQSDFFNSHIILIV
ncbi:unnamed protein product [Tenebrio molitor]|jgi:catenin alpha|nr:unnamed protein product [Tenebrio molitor]